MKIRPILSKVLVHMDQRDQMWGADSPLHRPQSAEEQPLGATVVGRGAGGFTRKGKRVPMTVQPGDHVLVPWATGTEMQIGGLHHRWVYEADILAVTD